MNQQERFELIIDKIRSQHAISEIDVDPDLARPKSLLKIMTATHHNWDSDRIRKLFGMRMSVKVPPIEQLNVILYPKPDYDVPIFIFFNMLTKRKMITWLNVNCRLDDPENTSRVVAPYVEKLRQYPSFECDDRWPEWMKKFRNEASIFGMFDNERAGEVTECMVDYLELYTRQLAAAKPETDPERLAAIRHLHEQFIDDIRTQDKAQGMIAKMIGKQKARRIFYELTT